MLAVSWVPLIPLHLVSPCNGLTQLPYTVVWGSMPRESKWTLWGLLRARPTTHIASLLPNSIGQSKSRGQSRFKRRTSRHPSCLKEQQSPGTWKRSMGQIASAIFESSLPPLSNLGRDGNLTFTTETLTRVFCAISKIGQYDIIPNSLTFLARKRFTEG